MSLSQMLEMLQMYLKTFESNCPLNSNFKVLNFFFGFMECKEKYWTDDELSRKRWHECLFKMLWDDHYNDTHVLTKYTQGTESSSQLWWKNTLELIWCSIRLNRREELSLFLFRFYVPVPWCLGSLLIFLSYALGVM